MARGDAKNVGKKVIDAIIEVASTNVRWSSIEIRNYLLTNYDKYKLKREDIPAKRTVQKYLAQYRVEIEESQFNPLNRPWDLAFLRDYEIPPEVALVVLEIQNRQNAENHRPLNIRQVLWAARLYPLIIKLQGGQDPHLSFALHFWCQLYASYEALGEVRRDHVVSSKIDQEFLESRADHTKSTSWPHMNDGYYYQVFSPWLL